MTVHEYDEHIGRVASFLASLVHCVTEDTDKERAATNEALYHSVGKAYMALVRERTEKYGYMED